MRSFFFVFLFSFVLYACNNNDDIADIKLNEEFQYLGVDEVFYLTTAIKAPEDKSCLVTWKSSDESIATVSTNGMVTALSEGKVVITATVEKKSVYCNIEVLTYNFNGASAYKNNNNANTPQYEFILMKNNGADNSNAEIKSGNVMMHLDIFTSLATPNLFAETYKPTDASNRSDFSFLKGENLEDEDLAGSYIEDKCKFNSTFLINDGVLTIVNSEGTQYLIRGDFSTTDLSGNVKPVSFIYSGNISLRSDPVIIF
ncbi:Ig-like domain-containing protein [Paludibacteraceae bacterium OttesenSCG-928-F17]|nr:Ig-like domain-containing protein [Paludibacteraceae bacterium OttesenSCG-928-F17]